jgi:tetratricopeptide (TPR) repeat protein
MADKEIEELFNKGQRLRQVNSDFHGAITCYDLVISKLSGTHDKLIPWALFEKGNALLRLFKNTDALEAFQQVIAFGKDDNIQYFWAMDRKGITHRKLKQYNEAIKTFDKIIELNSDYFEAWTGKGEVYEAMERFDDAKTCYEKAIALGENKWAPGLLRKIENKK